MNDLTDRIDVSLRKGRPIDDEVRPWLATLAALDPLAQVPPRAPEAMATASPSLAAPTYARSGVSMT